MIDNETIQLNSTIVSIAWIALAVGLVIGVIIFVVSVIVDIKNKNAQLLPLNSEYRLGKTYSKYLDVVEYNEREHAVLFKKSHMVNSMNITLVERGHGKTKSSVYFLDFTGDVVAIPLDRNSDQYAFEINNVNGQKIDEQSNFNHAFKATILAVVIMSLVTIIASIAIAVADSLLLLDAYSGYLTVYISAGVSTTIGTLGLGLLITAILNGAIYKGGK